MRRFRYLFLEEPRGPAYAQLLEFAVRNADVFSLTLTAGSRRREPATTILRAMRAHQIDLTETRTWPGTELMEGYTASLYRFHVHPEAIGILREAVHGFYEWQGPDRPDDLCFYRHDGSSLITSTAHQSEGDLTLNEEEREGLRSLAPLLRLKSPEH